MLNRPHRFVAAMLLLLADGRLLAWQGHSWDEWRKTTTWRRSDTKTLQSGEHELVAPLAPGPKAKGGIDEIRAWEKRSHQTRLAIEQILGGITPSATGTGTATQPTSRPHRDAPKVELLGEEQLNDHVRRHIRIQSEPDDWIPAYVLIPKNATGRRPAMICLHQTVAQGKEEPVGIKGDLELAFALELVRQGFVCIAPDAIGFGERIPPGTSPYHDSAAFFKRHPGWSFMGKMVWDAQRVVDYLETLPEVDPLQIGSIGHSHGAYGTLFAAAFDPRITVAIASCGFTTFRSDPRPERWSHLTALIPQLGTYLPHVEEIPFDWQDVCAMMAPRPLYVWYATKDTIFPKTENLDAVFRDVRKVYGLYGAADDLAWKAFDGPHRFPQSARQEAYAWLTERLFPTGNLHDVPKTREAWPAQRATLQRVIRRSLGHLPERPASLEVSVLERHTEPTYERTLIEYHTGPSDPVRAYLCTPRGAKDVPGILVLHQTTAEGKRESLGLAGDKGLAFGAELAERGYVTLSPDSITAGERIDSYKAFDTRGHYQRHPDVSAMGQMLYDAQVALDVLQRSAGVDPKRLGTIGHSLGAEMALMLAAFDERVCAAVSSCGYATFRSEHDKLAWARDHWFSYMPKLRPVFLRGALPDWDWDDVLRVIAPRGVFQYSAENDQIFPESLTAFEAAESARGTWALLEADDRLVNRRTPGPHRFDAKVKEEAYRWLDQQLKK